MSRGVWLLIGLLAVAGVALTGIDQLTRERISLQAQLRANATLTQLLPAERFDNDVVNDVLTVTAVELNQPMRIHRARLGDQPVATIADLTTPHGYSGNIRLLVAAEVDGEVIGVRVIAHRETPGLGDAIEVERSAWIHQFTGRRLSNETRDTRAWAPSRRGGEFDTLTSATITSSAVIDAVRAALLTQQQLGASLWAATPDPEVQAAAESPQ
jgi:electron transport complex protein RnfG